MKGLFKSGSLWFCVLAVLILAGGVIASALSWGWLHPPAPTEVSNSETLRNVGLLIGGTLAFVFAGWRAWVAERQANAAQRQAETTFVQAETTHQSLLNERYQRGVEMLGSAVLAVRMGGIYALKRLAEEHPQQYHIQVMELFCAFLPLPTLDEGLDAQANNHEGHDGEEAPILRPDMQEIMQAIGSRSPSGLSLEGQLKGFKLYLRDVNLNGVQLRDANLAGAWLTNADITGAVLPYVDLSHARLRRANLTRAEFRHANLSGATLWGADISGADLCGACARSTTYKESARGLTQKQLDQACSDPNNPPKLDGFVLDAATGKPLVWRGKPLISLD